MSSNAWVLCGDKAIPWLALVGALYYAITDQKWILEFYGTSNINILFWLVQSQHELTKGMKRMDYEILARHRQSIASDMRDTVFAFQGLSAFDNFEEDSIIPDYKVVAETLFTNLATAILSRASNLDFLSIPRLRSGEDGLDIPSWVPDWSSRTPLCLSFLQLESGGASLRDLAPYDATKDSLYHPVVNEQTKRLETPLQLSGFSVDKITSVSKIWELQKATGFQSIRKQAIVLQKNQTLINNWRSLTMAGTSPTSSYVTGETMYDALWQIYVAGIFPNGDKEKIARHYSRFGARQRILRYMTRWGLDGYVWVWMLVVAAGHLLRLLGIANPEMEFRTSVQFMINRRLVKSERGYVGMGPAIAEVGDEIALFRGGRTPMVIRARGRNARTRLERGYCAVGVYWGCLYSWCYERGALE